MSQAKGNQEPSMEEILASIRRIISEDGEPKEESGSESASYNGVEAASEEDEEEDLILTDMVVGDNNVVELQEEPISEAEAPLESATEPQPQPVITIQEEAAREMEFNINEPEIEADDSEPDKPEVDLSEETPMNSNLISPDVAAASAASMAQLIAKKPQTDEQHYGSLDGLLVETLVRQAIEPMLKKWLDENLQEIVERLVRREVERLSRKAELS